MWWPGSMSLGPDLGCYEVVVRAVAYILRRANLGIWAWGYGAIGTKETSYLLPWIYIPDQQTLLYSSYKLIMSKVRL